MPMSNEKAQYHTREQCISDRAADQTAAELILMCFLLYIR